MSDFGTAISIVKKDGKAFSSNEKQQIKNALKQIINTDELVNSLGESYNYEIQDVDDAKPTLFVQLSEHYFSGDEAEDQETFEFVEETELEDANHIISSLKTQFSSFNFNSSVEEW